MTLEATRKSSNPFPGNRAHAHRIVSEGLACMGTKWRTPWLTMLAVGISVVPPLQAESGAVTGSSGLPESWRHLLHSYESEFLVGVAVFTGIAVLSATILAFLVRHLKGRRETFPIGGEPSAALANAGTVSSRRSSARPGARAFPRHSAGGLDKPAASGNTTRLTPEGPSTTAEHWKEEQVPHGLQGRELMIVLAAWACLIAGLALMTRSPANYAVCVPVLLMAFLLAVMAMAQRLVLHGSLILVVLYVAAPAIWLVHDTGSEAPEVKSTAASSPTASMQPAREGQVPLAEISPSPTLATSATPANAKLPEAPKLLIPEDDVLPPSAAASGAPPSSVAPAPVLPPPPAKAADCLFAYRAKLSRADFLNQQGIDLRTLARTKFNDILMQERLHVHQHGRRDPEDTVDELLGARPFPEYRSLFEGKPIRMPSSVSLIQLVKRDDLIVDVQVFESFIQVDPVTPLATP